MSKKRRSSGLWNKCENENCQVYYPACDIELHKKDCPPSETCRHAFIKDGVYHFVIESNKDDKAAGNYFFVMQNLLLDGYHIFFYF